MMAIMTKLVKMALMAVMEWYGMATTMAIIGVYGKRRSLPSDMSADASADVLCIIIKSKY